VISTRALAALLLAAPLLAVACRKHDADTDTARSIPAAEAAVAPDFPADASRWLNGAPLPPAAARGGVVFVEAWEKA
jgi:hypothetical protein